MPLPSPPPPADSAGAAGEGGDARMRWLELCRSCASESCAAGGEADGGEGEEEGEKEAAAVQLIKPELCDEVLTPQMPHVSKSCARTPQPLSNSFCRSDFVLRD